VIKNIVLMVVLIYTDVTFGFKVVDQPDYATPKVWDGGPKESFLFLFFFFFLHRRFN